MGQNSLGLIVVLFTMLGQWDPVGIVLSIAFAVGGVAVGVWGLQRRDLRS